MTTINLLCETEVLCYEQIQDDVTLDVMLKFVNLGYWYFAEE